MTRTATQGQSAWMAGRILAAMRDGNLTDLESGLERAEQLVAHHGYREGEAFEQLELLSAVAGQMRLSISRFGSHLTPRLESIEVHLRLLHHLARLPLAPSSTCLRN